MNILPILLKRYLRVDTSSNLTDEQKKKNRVIIVGGGFSGIGMGCILKMAGMDFLILEKGSQVGGTWNYNKFPGAATDAKCAGYSFTFYEFKDWKRVYPYRKRIKYNSKINLTLISIILMHFKGRNLVLYLFGSGSF